MAQINLKRRAEIAADKRARTRAVILDAARECLGAAAVNPVTVEVVMQTAGLAKGTFYVHFQDLAELEAEVGAGLIKEIDDRLQPARLAIADPVSRIATATTILLHYLGAVPARARLAARSAAKLSDGDRAAILVHLREDLAAVEAAGRLALPSRELAARLVSAIAVQAITDLGQARLNSKAIPDIVRAILRAIGCTPADAAARAEQAARIADRFACGSAQSGDAKRRQSR